jgi:hypothetical protein
MNTPKLYTYFLPFKKPLGPGNSIPAGTKISFIEDRFLNDKKIVGFSIVENGFLTNTPQGDSIADQKNRTITLVNSKNQIIVDGINTVFFRQNKTAAGVYKQGGQIKKFKPFVLNFQKSFITAVQTTTDNLTLAINFWYYEI